jgi:hypothetical protein
MCDFKRDGVVFGVTLTCGGEDFHISQKRKTLKSENGTRNGRDFGQIPGYPVVDFVVQ